MSKSLWRGRLGARQAGLGVLMLAVLAVGAAVVGCGRRETGEAAGAASGLSPAERYPLRGEILRVEQARQQLVVKHEEIPGFMPAMTMEFAVSSGDLANAKPGQRIRATMVATPEGDYLLEQIWVLDPASEVAIAQAAASLRQDTAIRDKAAYREVGERLPDFALYDQDGRVFTAARFRGRQILLNFIFTRCPVATMCPLATATMQTAQRLAREAGVADLELVSISLDPEYDTPGVLKTYAMTRGIDTANFSLLTGPANAVRDLLTQFGVIASFEGDMAKHTLATLLINADGRIVWRADGSRWAPEEFVRRMGRGAPLHRSDTGAAGGRGGVAPASAGAGGDAGGGGIGSAAADATASSSAKVPSAQAGPSAETTSPAAASGAAKVKP